MRYGVLGTGTVGQTLGSRLVELGHEVRLGSRTADNAAGVAWADAAGKRAGHGSFAEVAAFGERVINATNGAASLDALRLAGEEALRGKLLIDVANVLDFSGGFPPLAGVALNDSLAERIQREFPATRVVKTLNTVAVGVMVDPKRLAGAHAIFLCGDDHTAKNEAKELLLELGFSEVGIIDLGGIAEARGPELYLALWTRMMQALGGPGFNIAIVRG